MLPVIAGFVEMPNDLDNSLPLVTPAEVLAAIPGTAIEYFGITDIRQFVTFPGFDSTVSYAEDFYQQVKNIALAKL